MKIAVSSTGKDVSSKVSEVFARCPYFIVAEISDKQIKGTEAMENTKADQLGQAGISVAQLMAEKEIEAVITKNLGPRAADALNQLKIKVYCGDGLVKDILQEFIEGNLKKFQ